MLDKYLSFMAPHYCCGCGKIGGLICHNCKYNIIDEREIICIACHQPTVEMSLCRECTTPYLRAWVVGRRDGVLQRLIGLYKFQRAKSAYRDLGDLILEILPELPPDTIVVYIPTISSHIRERGYDHMFLIAKYIAHKRGLKCEKLLKRKTKTKQRQASAALRETQAKQAFYTDNDLDENTPYLIIDDVVTTGATLRYAAKALRAAGAKQIWVAAVAWQGRD